VAESRREKEKVLSIEPDEAAGDPRPLLNDDPLSGTDAPGTDAAAISELAKLRAEKDELLQTLVQRQADFENYRKRVERDRHEEGRRGVAQLISDIIPVVDAFDRALKAHDDPAYEEYRNGVKLIRKQLWDALARHGVQRIDAAGQMFDPNIHQAIERAESNEHPDGFILDVFQDGYSFHGRVLRPAIVRVVVHPADDEAADTRKMRN
jgi:molecular chaperone GrpE